MPRKFNYVNTSLLGALYLCHFYMFSKFLSSMSVTFSSICLCTISFDKNTLENVWFFHSTYALRCFAAGIISVILWIFLLYQKICNFVRGMNRIHIYGKMICINSLSMDMLRNSISVVFWMYIVRVILHFTELHILKRQDHRGLLKYLCTN